MSINGDKWFWGKVIGLSSLIAGSLYYLYSLLPEGNDDDDDNNEDISDIALVKNNTINEEALIKIMVKIDEIANKLYARDYKNEDEKRRQLLDISPKEYNDLCKEKMINKEFLNQVASEKVLKQLKTQVSLETLKSYLKNIPLNKIEELSIKYFNIDKKMKLPPVDIIKQAFKYYCDISIEKIQGLVDKYRYAAQTETLEQEKGFDFLITKENIEDLLIKNFKIDTQTMIVTLHKTKSFDTDSELKKLKERLDKFNQVLTN